MVISLGALNKITNEYVYPKIANKDNEYICPDCKKDLILKQGNIRIHHFAHSKDNLKCNYYDKPSESQIHKDAKLLLKNILENEQKITFIRKCNNKCCKEKYKIPNFSDTSEILLEYKFFFNNSYKIADVAYIDNSERVGLFEIYHSHNTKESDRPEPWFEINATELINQINDIDNKKIKINCIRKNINCKNCQILEENYIDDNKINCKNSKLLEKNSIDISKSRKIFGTESYKIFCSGCGCDNYEPICYNNINYALCKKCLIDDKYKNILNQINKEIKIIPILYKKNGSFIDWKQNLNCKICKRKKYNPYYSNNKNYAICRSCFYEYKTKYNIILKELNYKIN
jgi:hypothetical protein